MNNQNKRFKLFIMVIALIVAIQMPAVASANSLSDLKDEKSEIDNKKKELNDQIKEKRSEISSVEDKQDTLVTQISQLSSKIESTNNSISSLSSEIEKAKEEIKKLKEEIAVLQDKIDQRDELLKERVRALQKNGSISYLDVLLGANSFVDFIDRFSAINTLMEADRQIMKEQKADKEKLEEQQVALENKKQKLESDKKELVNLKNSLNTQKSEKNALVDELEAEQKQLVSQQDELEAKYSEAVEISNEINNKIIAEQQRQIELARKQEEERKRKAAEAAAAKANSNGNTTSESSNESGSVPAVSSGSWTRPAAGSLTSPYGYRTIFGAREFHYGIDIANSTGTPIVAAAGGVITYAAPLSSYGNVIIMTNSVDGKIFTTVYAHLSGFNVSVGQSVEKGQQIGRMGSTGRSTGPHLHFEIHTGSWQGQKVNSVNPLRYISL